MKIEITYDGPDRWSRRGWWHLEVVAGRFGYFATAQHLPQAIYWLIRGLWRTRKPKAKP